MNFFWSDTNPNRHSTNVGQAEQSTSPFSLLTLPDEAGAFYDQLNKEIEGLRATVDSQLRDMVEASRQDISVLENKLREIRSGESSSAMPSSWYGVANTSPLQSADSNLTAPIGNLSRHAKARSGEMSLSPSEEARLVGVVRTRFLPEGREDDEESFGAGIFMNDFIHDRILQNRTCPDRADLEDIEAYCPAYQGPEFDPITAGRMMQTKANDYLTSALKAAKNSESDAIDKARSTRKTPTFDASRISIRDDDFIRVMPADYVGGNPLKTIRRRHSLIDGGSEASKSSSGNEITTKNSFVDRGGVRSLSPRNDEVVPRRRMSLDHAFPRRREQEIIDVEKLPAMRTEESASENLDLLHILSRPRQNMEKRRDPPVDRKKVPGNPFYAARYNVSVSVEEVSRRGDDPSEKIRDSSSSMSTPASSVAHSNRRSTGEPSGLLLANPSLTNAESSWTEMQAEKRDEKSVKGATEFQVSRNSGEVIERDRCVNSSTLEAIERRGLFDEENSSSDDGSCDQNFQKILDGFYSNNQRKDVEKQDAEDNDDQTKASTANLREIEQCTSATSVGENDRKFLLEIIDVTSKEEELNQEEDKELAASEPDLQKNTNQLEAPQKSGDSSNPQATVAECDANSAKRDELLFMLAESSNPAEMEAKGDPNAHTTTTHDAESLPDQSPNPLTLLRQQESIVEKTSGISSTQASSDDEKEEKHVSPVFNIASTSNDDGYNTEISSALVHWKAPKAIPSPKNQASIPELQVPPTPEHLMRNRIFVVNHGPVHRVFPPRRFWSHSSSDEVDTTWRPKFRKKKNKRERRRLSIETEEPASFSAAIVPHVGGEVVAVSPTKPSIGIEGTHVVAIKKTVQNGQMVLLSEVQGKLIKDPYGDEGTYTGIMLDGLPHGEGAMDYADGRSYSGEWRRGRWHGRGRAKFVNGDVFTGRYERDRRHGKGRYQWADGRVYDGEFVRNQRQGHGKYSWPDGAVYVGGFVNGQRHGEGRYCFADGSVYKGEWKNGKYEGVGECTWASGRKYHGEWKAGKAEGFGIEYRPDGSIRHEGMWKADRPLRNTVDP